MARAQLRAAIALAFCVNAILWQVSESATVVPPTTANPCATMTCTPPRTCKVDQKTNQPKCVCPQACTMNYQPVCGSNGKTYSNQCQLDVDACQTNTTITTVNNGNCEGGAAGASSTQNGTAPTANPCATMTCTSPRTCQVDPQTNQPKCVCPSVCPMIYQPVCGSNGKTYGNQCQLNADACQTNTTITTVYNGNCEDRATGAPSTQNGTAVTANPCATITCASLRTCQVDQQSNQAKCVCQRACSRMYKPVCGSNDKTYSNECELNGDACETNTTITTVFNGTCEARKPCDTVRCREGYYCQVDQTNGTRCVCPEVCTADFKPVCGSDGKTYSNRCQLSVTSCQAGTYNAVAYEGQCTQDRATGAPSTQNGTATPCATITCASPRICEVDQLSNQPKCVCSGICNRMYKPVCGSNGKTYSNECELTGDACRSNTTLTIIFNGTCEARSPCDTVRCREGYFCKVDQTNATKCVCPEVCTADFNPVCGSDGKTYSNRCQFYVTYCKSGINSTVAYQGACAQGTTDRCAAVSCTQGAKCQVNDQNETRCVCNEACTKILAQVCGSDGITYGNQCELDKAACKSGTTISVVNQGECGKANPCSTMTCASPRTCQVDQQTNQPKCVCPAVCPMISQPVCGSNGKTYGNQCQLDVDACDTNTTITTAYNGNCEARSPCDTVRCREGYFCQVDQTNAARCVCTEVCTADNNPVCGSDGKTYSNRCQLYSTSCKSGTNSTVAYQGACAQGTTDRCAAVSCTQGAKCQVNDQNETRCVCNEACTKILAQVCGSDGITYANQCELDKAACMSGTTISVVSQGECGKATSPCAAIVCPQGARCQVNDVNEGKCVCNEVCNGMYAPVCGSDGRTYRNQCELDTERCKRNQKLTVVCRGVCQGSGRKLKCRSADI